MRIKDLCFSAVAALSIVKTALTKPYALLSRILKQGEESRTRHAHEVAHVNARLEAQIGRRKTPEDTQRESEECARLIIETASDAFISINAASKITTWNAQAETLFGWSRSEAVGREVTETIIPSRYREAYLRNLEHLLKTGESPILDRRIEITVCRRDGEVFPVELAIWAARSGENHCLSTFIRNITERRRAEEELRLQNAALMSAANGIVITNRKGDISWVNPAFTALTGYTSEEILGQNPRFLKSGKQDEEFYRRLWETILSGQVWHAELVNRRKDGSLYAEEETITPVRDERGEISHFIAIKLDITDRKQAEEELRALNESLEQHVAERTQELEHQMEELARSNTELEQFVHIASHDLQEPLRMVTSYTQLLAQRYEGKLDSDADDFIAYAVGGAKRMQELIQDLLVYSRLVRKVGKFESADCETVLQHTLADMGMVIEESGAVVTHDALPTLTADQVQLGQVFQNLIENAIKFRREDPPQVHVSARQHGDDWVFSVRDNGIGIDPEYAERIFVIFQRLHGKEEYPGTGMGLTICKKIIERHGGRIWVESEAGEGATFHFSIPAVAETRLAA